MRRVAGAALAVVLLTGCPGGNGDTIPVGALLPTTGQLSALGAEQLRAVQLAVNQINAAGGVLGKDLRVVHEDDSDSDTKVEEGAQALVDAAVPVVIGAVGSAHTLAAAAISTPP